MDETVRENEEKKMGAGQPIYSMWLREIIRFFHARSRIFSMILQPFLFLGLFALPLSGLFRGQQDLDMFGGLTFFAYLVPGMLAINLLFRGTRGGVSVLWDKDFGFLKEVMVAPVSRTTLIVGRSLGQLTTALIEGLITLGVALLFGIWFDFRIASVAGFLGALVFMILTFVTFVSFGLIMGSLFEDTEGFMTFVQLITMPIFFLSGAITPINQLQDIPVLYQLQFVNPLTYGVDAIRSLITGVPSVIPIWTDFVVLLAWAIVLVLLGGYAFSKMEVD
ncbi:MAG: ABC transporter permease [Candidatus Thermoplasmatota archaeon]|nr:ABC transporter permease [Candidatus Thermoplasmatota archaeon]